MKQSDVGPRAGAFLLARPLRRWCACILLALALPMGAYALNPSQTEAVVQHAGSLLEWGRWKEARALLANSLNQDPDNARLLAYDAHVLLGFGDVGAALQRAKQAVSLDGHCGACHLFLSEALGEKAKQMSKLRALFELRKIKKQLQLASALAPNLPDVHWGWINFNLEVPAAAGGDPRAAVRQAEALATVDPVDGHIARAAIALAAGNDHAALAQYLQAAHQYPNDPRGQFYVGFTYFEQGQYAAAKPYLERAQRLQPQSSLYSAYLAATYIHLRQEPTARQLLSSALALHPDSRLVEFLVAKALRQIGSDFDWARQLLRHYLATSPEPDQPTEAEARQLLASLG